LDYAGLRFPLHHGRLEQPLQVGGQRHSLPLAATSFRLIAKPLFNADTGFTLQAKRIINAKKNIYNECSNYLERKV
jgi:hypothetical protein